MAENGGFKSEPTLHAGWYYLQLEVQYGSLDLLCDLVTRRLH